MHPEPICIKFISKDLQTLSIITGILTLYLKQSSLLSSHPSTFGLPVYPEVLIIVLTSLARQYSYKVSELV